ncbi:hypothetical protein [Phenylobacterium sp.]|uniref:hypothetical protein n=1 Tax=Phenylobacterium sp. TaxID=1871053 RepID=UPI0011FA80E5|nr:hypothetical protein [Phenylobacterium sp.]THD59062.1 MAG: hypothetical protein E8A12_11945 [Phenylobacterium sp.]
MDIHKPKPWHGLREFLKEYAIIVVGVLTALGAEQIAETLHWQEKVRHGEAQERLELSNVYSTATERIHLERCLDARLDTLAQALLAHDGPWTPLPLMNNGRLGEAAYEPPLRAWYEGVWNTLVADGTANHLAEQQELLYAGTYSEISLVREWNRREVEEAEALSVLQHPTELSRAERNALVERIEQERGRNHMIALGSDQLMQTIRRITTVDPNPSKQLLEGSPVIKACARLGLPT